MAMNRFRALLGCGLVVFVAAGTLQAATMVVSSNITVSETWTSDNEYILDQPIYVTNGATLTIAPGTVVRGDPESSPGVFDPGTLIIARGSKIMAMGTALKPIVFTDLDDDNIGGNRIPTPPYDTLANAQGVTGQWGGVILLGYGFVANNTVGGPNPAREVQIEGLSAAGALGRYGNCQGSLPGPYGRNCDDADSGSLSYASIRYGGFNLATNNEINGLTLGGVGRATRLDHIEVFQNKDDQVEIFGGAPNLKYVATYAGGDDGLDYDEGYRGKVQFFFMVQGTPGADKSDKGGEWDGGNSGDASEPRSIPDLYNMTFVGLGQKAFTNRNQNTVVHFRDNAGGRVYNSAFLDFGGANGLIEGTSASGTGASSSGERTQADYSLIADANFYLQTPTTGKQLELTNNTWWCTANFDTNGDTQPDFFSGTGGNVYGADPADSTKIHFDPGIFSNASFANTYLGCATPLPIQALVRTPSGDVTTPDSVTSIDPRPTPAGPLATGSVKAPPADGFFEPVTYRGAFSPTQNWAEGWTVMSRLGLFPTALPLNPPQVVKSANITVSETWTPNNVYVLDNPIYVTNGATLTIQPGTVVRGQPESSPGAFDPGTLIIARGAKISAVGTPDRPIVFTDLDDGNFGDVCGVPPYDTVDNARSLTGAWGGVILLGYGFVANNTVGGPNPAREVQIEGLSAAGALGRYGNCQGSLPGPYGRNCDDADSGSLSYASIRYGGFNLATNNEINGLTLGGVGRATRLDHIEVFQNKDDQVEIFGGAPNLKYVATYAGGDDGLDYDEGYRGKVQFFFMVQGTPGADKSDKGGEWDGGNAGDASEPRSIPDLYNMTFVGLGQKAFTNRNQNTVVHFRDNAGGRVYNSAFLDFGGANGLIEGTSASGTGASSSGERTQADYSLIADANFYLQTPTTGKQLELTNNTWWCTANFDTNGDAQPDFFSGTGGNVYGADPADSTKIHFDPGIFSNASFANTYLGCATPLPIQALVRTTLADGTVPNPVESIDPRPTAAGPLVTGTVKAQPTDAFLERTRYRGAFPPGSNWAASWGVAGRLGLIATCDPVTGLPSTAVPDEVAALRLSGKAPTTLSWNAVAFNGKAYNALRAATPSDFTGATCLEATAFDDNRDTFAVDSAIPSSGQGFYYLIRAVNVCGAGTLGFRSNGIERTGVSCP